jgi:putative monooxygenase
MTIESATSKVAAADVAANRRRGGDLRVLLSPKTVCSTAGFMGSLVLQPGERVSEHYHPYSEEYLYVVSGRLEMRLGGPDGERVELGPDDALMVPKNVPHRLENNGTEPAKAVFQLAPLAPSPELGHVDTEEPPRPAEVGVQVGGRT